MDKSIEHIAKGTKYTRAYGVPGDAGTTAIMLLYDEIGYNPETGTGIRGSWFAEEMYYHKQAGRQVCVYINSPGGQVYDGFNIIQAIEDCGADTHIVGMAASMAGIISQFGKKRTMNDFAIGMIHGVGGSDKDSKLTTITQQQLKECLMKRSNLNEKAIDKMMAPGNEEWMDSSEMLEKGLIDEVVITGKSVDNAPKLKNLKKNFETTADVFKIYTSIVNELTLKPTNDTDMEELKKVGAELGIENATSDSVVAKIKELKTASTNAADLQTKLTAAEKGKTDAEAAKKTAEDSLATERKARATELVENAILAGKIKEDSKQEFIDLANTNYDLAKKTLNAIQTTAAAASTVHNFLGAPANGGTAATEDYETLARTNPEKLAKIANEEPEKFARLQAAYIQKQQTNQK